MDAASRAGTAQRARCELRCGIGAGSSSLAGWPRLPEGSLGTAICGVGCSGSLG